MMKHFNVCLITAVLSSAVFAVAHWATGFVYSIFNVRHDFSLGESALYGAAVAVLVFVVLFFTRHEKCTGKA